MELSKEILLKKFNGDVYMAAAYSQGLADHMEQRCMEAKKMFDPNGPYMKSLVKENDEEFDWIITPWWKKVLIKLQLMNC